MRDMYNFAKRFKLAKDKLEGSQVSAENKNLIFKFIEYKQARAPASPAAQSTCTF